MNLTGGGRNPMLAVCIAMSKEAASADWWASSRGAGRGTGRLVALAPSGRVHGWREPQDAYGLDRAARAVVIEGELLKIRG